IAGGLFDGTVRLFDANTGRAIVTFLAVSGQSADGDWLALTPEAFADGSDALIAKARWQASGQALLPAPMWKALRHGELLGTAMRGDKLPDPVFSGAVTAP